MEECKQLIAAAKEGENFSCYVNINGGPVDHMLPLVAVICVTVIVVAIVIGLVVSDG